MNEDMLSVFVAELDHMTSIYIKKKSGILLSSPIVLASAIVDDVGAWQSYRSLSR